LIACEQLVSEKGHPRTLRSESVRSIVLMGICRTARAIGSRRVRVPDDALRLQHGCIHFVRFSLDDEFAAPQLERRRCLVEPFDLALNVGHSFAQVRELALSHGFAHLCFTLACSRLCSRRRLFGTLRVDPLDDVELLLECCEEQKKSAANPVFRRDAQTMSKGEPIDIL